METVSLVLSLVSLLVACVGTYVAYWLGRRQIHLLARHEYHKLLLELDKELIRDPTLWGLYQNHAMYTLGPVSNKTYEAKLEAFAFLMLNLFEMVFAFESEAGLMTQADREFYEGWRGTCRDSVENAPIIRAIIDRPDCQNVFGQNFLTYLKKLKEDWRQKNQPEEAHV